MIDMVQSQAWKTYLKIRFPGLMDAVRNLEASQWWSTDQIRELQWRKLQEIVGFAYEHVPYYRQTWKACGFHPSDLRSYDQFSQLPTLDRSTVRENMESLTCRARLKGAQLNASGGSTGIPVRIYQDKPYQIYGKASTIRHDEWTGWRLGQPILRIWGAQRDVQVGLWQQLGRKVARDENINAFDLSEQTLANAKKSLINHQPKLLIGYASALEAFANYLERTGGAIPHSLQGIISSAETLSSQTRRTVERVLKTTLYNRYGGRELGLLASDCDHGNMHVCAETSYIEFQEPYGNGYHLIVTNLTNTVMPLIRYRVGDVGRESKESCPCGRGLPIMKEILGRTTDFVLTSSGDLISGPGLTTVLMMVRELKQVQLYQPSRGKLTVRIVHDADYTKETENYLRKKLGIYLGQGTDIQFEYLESIPIEASGKYRFTISDIAAHAK